MRTKLINRSHPFLIGTIIGGSLGISAISRSRFRADSMHFLRSSSVSLRIFPSSPKHDGGMGAAVILSAFD
jgi:hypothetical protein